MPNSRGNLPASPDPFHLSADADECLQRWIWAVLEAPGLTSLTDHAEARRMLLEDSLRGVELVRGFEGPIVDVGSGGGAPGIPLAAALPDREVTLLEAERRKVDFLRRWEAELSNLKVVWGRAEEQGRDEFGIALAKALAPPPVAAEWCLPLVRAGGAAILWVGPTAEVDRVKRVAEQLAAAPPEDHDGLLVIRKLGPTPEGFPRRPGIARKRPLA
ncbi:MAG: 16S rRNA (guanine(527)-N(7))-methyltransferase RsmG [Gaiellaceae bacterium]